MTALNVVITDRAAHIVTDGASYRDDGTIVCFMTKVFTAPHLRAIIATRGPGGITHAIGHSVCSSCSTFDELVGGEMLRDVVDRLRSDYERGGEPVSVVVAGWSEEADRPQAWRVDVRESAAIQRIDGNLMMSPGQSPETLRAAGFVLASDSHDKAFRNSMVDLMEIQRRMLHDGRHTVGGFCSLTTVERDRIMQRIIHRWDDHVGEQISPTAIPTAQFQQAWGTAQVNGSDFVMSIPEPVRPDGHTVLMRYPPEGAPALRGIPDISQRFRDQAMAAIKQETGQDVTPEQLRVAPIPQRTSRAYWRGESPPYSLSWQDANGVLHTLAPGRGFMFDPKAEDERLRKRTEQSRERRNFMPGSGEPF